jgi:hypothetical protein
MLGKDYCKEILIMTITKIAQKNKAASKIILILDSGPTTRIPPETCVYLRTQ